MLILEIDHFSLESELLLGWGVPPLLEMLGLKTDFGNKPSLKGISQIATVKKADLADLMLQNE